MAFPLRQRLLRDIAEMQIDPYPNITLHMNDSLTQACLILSPEGQDSLHLTMVLYNYPLQAPIVTIQSKIRHPNVLGTYICASILNTKEGYTPAYTLKSTAIQLLSFFSSETLEQEYGGVKDLGQYRQLSSNILNSYHCVTCGFDDEARRREKQAVRLGEYFRSVTMATSKQCRKRAALLSRQNSGDSTGAGRRKAKVSKLRDAEKLDLDETANAITSVNDHALSTLDLGQRFLALPDEILLMIFAELSDQDLRAVAKVFPVTSEILNSYDFIRVRELQCFCLKESFMNVKLGVGVHIHSRGRIRKCPRATSVSGLQHKDISARPRLRVLAAFTHIPTALALRACRCLRLPSRTRIRCEFERRVGCQRHLPLHERHRRQVQPRGREMLRPRLPKLIDPRLRKSSRILLRPLPSTALPRHGQPGNHPCRERENQQLPRGPDIQILLS